MYGFAAAMTIDDNMQMIIMQDGDNNDRPNNANTIKELVEKVSGRTVYVGKVDRGKKAAAKIRDPRDNSGYKDQYRKSAEVELKKLFREKGKIHTAVDLFFGTRFVAMCFSADSRASHEERIARRQKIRQMWLDMNGPKSFKMKDGVSKFLLGPYADAQTANRPRATQLPTNKKIVVLWSRYSGKRGNAHIEYDSSMTGLTQLAQKAFQIGADIVVLAGDPPTLPDRFPEADKEKRRQFVNNLRANVRGPIVDLLAFWERPEWKTVAGATKPTRLDQYKVFEVLDEDNTVKHFGARSGNLEALSLLGYTVRYFEDGFVDEPSASFLWDVRRLFDEAEDPEQPGSLPPPALDKQRMEPWHDTVGYKRIVVSEVPTRSGKYLIETGARGDKWTYKARGTDTDTDKPDLSAYSRGFNVADLMEIERYLRFV
jgi:hypothetical protein